MGMNGPWLIASYCFAMVHNTLGSATRRDARGEKCVCPHGTDLRIHMNAMRFDIRHGVRPPGPRAGNVHFTTVSSPTPEMRSAEREYAIGQWVAAIDPAMPMPDFRGASCTTSLGQYTMDRGTAEKGKSRPGRVLEIKEMCRTCPLYDACGTWALSNRLVAFDPEIYAGMTRGERVRILEALTTEAT